MANHTQSKAEACLAVFDEVGVNAPMKQIKAALAARGVTMNESYIYDQKKVYRKKKGVAPAKPANGKPAARKPSGKKAAAKKSAARKKAPEAPAAHTLLTKSAAAPVVEAVQTAQHLLRLVGPADAHQLLDMLAGR
jgi:hypothetical protein